jgi:predicted glutamine amidotransferase
MCQLLGMNCNVPTDICFSFTGFQARGGLTDVHRDGWGIAFFEGKGVRQFLDHEPSAHSKIAELVKSYPIKSKNVIAHIRKATQGGVALENTHPFSRELWGYNWIFAHNGNVLNFNFLLDGSFQPIGRTDSENIFCWLMQELRNKFGNTCPDDQTLFSTVAELTKKVGALGEFNFLLSNGVVQMAHCSTKLTYIIRKAPFNLARLKDQEMTIDFSTLTTEKDQVAIIATTPLTENESWITINPGSLLLFKEGAVISELKTVAFVKKSI